MQTVFSKSTSVKHLIFMFISLCNKSAWIGLEKNHHGLALTSYGKWTAGAKGLLDPSTSTPHPAPPVRGLPALLSTSLPDTVQWCIFCINFCDRCCLVTLLADGACLCLILLRKVLSSRVTNWRHPVACHTAAEGGFWCRCLTWKSLRTVRTDSLVTKSAHILDQERNVNMIRTTHAHVSYPWFAGTYIFSSGLGKITAMF